MNRKIKEKFERLEMFQTMINLKHMFCEEKEIQDIMVEFYLIKRNVILCTTIDKFT